MVGLVMIDFYQLWGFHSRCLRFIILFEICFWVCGQPAPSRDRGACQVLVVTQKGEFSVLQLGIDLLGSISLQSFSRVAKWTLEACCPVSSALNEKEKKKKRASRQGKYKVVAFFVVHIERWLGEASSLLWCSIGPTVLHKSPKSFRKTVWLQLSWEGQLVMMLVSKGHNGLMEGKINAFSVCDYSLMSLRSAWTILRKLSLSKRDWDRKWFFKLQFIILSYVFTTLLLFLFTNYYCINVLGEMGVLALYIHCGMVKSV